MGAQAYATICFHKEQWNGKGFQRISIVPFLGNPRSLRGQTLARSISMRLSQASRTTQSCLFWKNTCPNKGEKNLVRAFHTIFHANIRGDPPARSGGTLPCQFLCNLPTFKPQARIVKMQDRPAPRQWDSGAEI